MLNDPQGDAPLPAKIKVGPGDQSYVRVASVKTRPRLALALDTFHAYVEIEMTGDQVKELRDALTFWLDN